jgi:uncharacterized membrane protein YgcG
MKKLSHFLVLLAFLLSTILAAVPVEVFASANDFSFKKFDADYYLKKNANGASVMEVTETLVAEFPNYNQNHGIERKLNFLNQNDTNLTMESTDSLEITVTRNGSSEPFTVSAYSDYFLVRIGDPNVYVQGEQTYVLKYKYVNVITSFSASHYATKAYQELYWDSNGTGWSQNFSEVNVNLHMDSDIYNHLETDRTISGSASYTNKSLIHENNITKNKLAAWCYVGRYGANNQNRCTISDIENGINFNAKNLSSGENLTFVTNFNDKTFVVPKNNYIKYLTYKTIDYDYYISRNSDNSSTVKVKEKIVGLFPTTNKNTGFSILVPFVNRDGTNFITENQNTLDVKVTLDGKKLNNSDFRVDPSSIYSGFFYITTGNSLEYIHDEHTLTLEYEFKNIVSGIIDNSGDRFQVFHINPIEKYGTDVNTVTVNVHLDKDIKEALSKNKESTCSNESTSTSISFTCQAKETSDGFTFYVDNVASSYNNSLSVDVYFNDNTFIIPEPNRNYLYYHIFAGVIIILGAVFAIFYKVKYTTILDKVHYLKNRPIVPEYAPHKELTAGQAAELYIHPTKNAKVATMLELIVNKKIALKKGKKKFFGGYEWSGELLDCTDLSKEQHDLLRILNGGVALDKVGETFDIKSHGYSSSIESAFKNYDTHTRSALKDKGFFESKTKSKKSYSQKTIFTSFITIIVAATCCIIGIGSIIGLGESLINWYVRTTGFTPFSIYEGEWTLPLTIIAALLTFLLIPILSIRVEKYKERSLEGLDAIRYLDGLKLYINMAERERLEFLQSVEGVDTSADGIVKLNEKLLPYAALFGLEKSWMKELERYYELHDEVKPEWYTAGFHYSVMHSVMGGALSRPIDTSSSGGGGGGFSSSSGSSGGGGGGFSGGGGGGGGGGGW